MKINLDNKKKKEKIAMSVIIGISAFILVAAMFMQFKVVYKTDIMSIENLKESELRSELITWKEKYAELQKKQQDTLLKIQEYRDDAENDEKTEKLLENELSSLKILLGKTNVEGQGIIITINEDNLEDDRINYEDLLYIINALKGAGAEAISINNNRIVNITDIVDTGEITRVNSKIIFAPYIIKVIGNQTYLESALIGRGGYVDELQKFGFDIDIQRSDKVQIEAYTNELSTKYVN